MARHINGVRRGEAGEIVRIGDTDVGRGLFLLRDVVAGERILEFRGRTIDFAGTVAKGDRECDALQIGPGLYLDLDPPGVFINHSCEPNTGIRDDLHLMALCELRAGDEIRFDYSTTMDDDHWTLDCRCGSHRCRGVIRDFKWLPRDCKIGLILQQVVPSFILTSELSSGRLTFDEIERSRAERLANGSDPPGPLSRPA